jgi:hypothetical protein
MQTIEPLARSGHSPQVQPVEGLTKQVVDAALAKTWLPSETDRVVVACTPHHLHSGGQAASTVEALIGPLRAAYPTAQIALVVCGVHLDSDMDPGQGHNLAGLAEGLGVEMVHVSKAPSWNLRVPQPTLPVRVPALAFTRHTLVTVASLSTDPYDGLSGMLASHLGLFPDLSRPELWPFRHQGLELALKLWPPDLCILDAQQVVLRTETRTSQSADVHPMNCLLAGRDPSAVDRLAACLLGLREEQVSWLRSTSLRMPAQEEEVIQVGDALPPPFPPPTSPHVLSQRMKDGVYRFGYHIQRMSNRCIDGLGIARIVDFVQCCREVPQ